MLQTQHYATYTFQTIRVLISGQKNYFSISSKTALQARGSHLDPHHPYQQYPALTHVRLVHKVPLLDTPLL